MDYNTQRKPMAIPEYGRHIHILVDFCKQLEDRDERNRMARGIIDVMGNFQPHLRDVADFKHKLWDQLFIMADFDLDVDSPYEIPVKTVLNKKPKKLPYPKLASKYRYYGNNIQTMIDLAVTWEDSEVKDQLVYTIANHMKKCYLLWNKDTVTDDIIAEHLLELSDNKLSLKLDNNELTDTNDLLKIQNPSGKLKGKKKKK